MALFDLLAPVFSSIDEFIAPFAPAFIRIAFWALSSALVSTLVFKKLSNPEKISKLKLQLKNLQNELNNHEGEFSELKGVAIQTLKVSIKRMGLTFLPAMIASIPIIFVLTYLSNNYGLKTPKPEQYIPINMVLENEETGYKFVLIQNKKIVDNGNIENFQWPDTQNPMKLVESKNNATILELPVAVSSIIHKKQWWNSLIGNPIGYLPDDSSLNRIELSFESQQIISVGPKWMHGWMFVFFSMTVLFSIVFLILFKIKF